MPNTSANHTECFMKTFLMWNTFIQLPLKSTERKTERVTEASLMCSSWPAWAGVHKRCILDICGRWKFSDKNVFLVMIFPHLFYSMSFVLFFADFDCSDPLGMESGEITSEQIMASSQYNPSWSPERSRLNYYENSWTPAEDSNKEWIQVMFLVSYREKYFLTIDDCFLKFRFSPDVQKIN